ncbi:MAG: hypothetical protein ABR498_02145 [Candidatus Dormibacteria bacterium]
MSDASKDARPQLRPGRCAVVLRVFDSPSKELRDALHPPWPNWMARLYEAEARTDAGIDVSEGVTTVSAAVSALKDKLAHRLDVLSFVCGALQDLGWDVALDGEALIATAEMTPEQARRQLDDAGVAGPMCVVADLDDHGWPWIRDVAAVADRV